MREEGNGTMGCVGSKPSSGFYDHFRLICSIRNPEKAVHALFEASYALLRCEISTICMFNEDTGNYLVVSSTGDELPTFDDVAKESIGEMFEHVFNTGPVLINSEGDKESLGFQVDKDIKSLLIVPAADTEDQSTCLMAFKNKLNSRFTDQCLQDAESFTYLGELVLKTYLIYKQEVNNEIQCRALLDIIKAVGTADTEAANSFLFTVSRRSQELFRAEKCTMYVVDKPREILWSASTDSGKQIKLPMSSGVVGAVAMGCKSINIPNAYADPRFNKNVDEETGYKTKSILCAPVTTHSTTEEGKKECVAVIQLINKSTSTVFSKEDEELLNQLCEILGDRITDGILLESFRSQFVVNSNTVVNEANAKLKVRTRRRSITGSISEDPGSVILEAMEE